MVDESSPESLEESNRRINEESVLLSFINTPDLTSTLRAYIDPSGRLVISGHDLGPTVAQFWPDDEYEYWLMVKAEYIPSIRSGLRDCLDRRGKSPPSDALLLDLLLECFQASIFETDSQFRAWLTKRKVPSEFSSWT